MKFSRALVLYLSLMVVPSVLAIPLRHSDLCSPGNTDIRCIRHEDDQGRIPNSHLNGGDTLCELQYRNTPYI